MPKVGMEPVRKRQIIDATMGCIHEHGMAKTTLQRIAARAGFASGLIVHYFGDKDGLLEAVYLDLYSRLEAETACRRQRANTPMEELFAVLEAQVCAEMVAPEIVSTWFALGAKAPETPGLSKMEQNNTRQLTSGLVRTLKRVGLSRSESRDIAEELVVLIYGLWVNLANKTIPSSRRAKAILFRVVRARLPQFFEATS